MKMDNLKIYFHQYWQRAQEAYNKPYFVWVLMGGSMVFYFLCIAYPLYLKQTALLNDITQTQKLLVWLKEAGADIARLKSVSPLQKVKPYSSLITVLEAQSDTPLWKSAVTDIEAQEDKSVAMTFDNIYFDDLMSGIELLQTQYDIHVIKINVSRTGVSDLVRASVLFQG